MSSEIEPPFRGVLSDVIAGAAVGFAFGGPAGAAGGLLLPVMERMMRLSQAELSGRQSRAAAMWHIAAREADTSVDELLDAASQDERLTHLGYTAADAAATSLYPARIVALGRVLASGIAATDAAQFDHWQLIVDTIEEVDRPHMVVLSRFANVEGTFDAPVFVRRTLDWSDVKQLNREYKGSVSSLLARLERLGLVHAENVATLAADDGRPGDEERAGSYWRLSDFGYEVLSELWRAGGSSELPADSIVINPSSKKHD